jgi:hypothetical protein
MLWICWNAGTALGVLLGNVIGDPNRLGLDAAFPLFFALLVPQLKGRSSVVAAGLGAAIALGLIPFTAAVLAALVVTQAVGGHRELVVDARLAGLGVGAVAVALRAPLLAVVVAAAATAALVRLLNYPAAPAGRARRRAKVNR